jgi:hypothetical protein
MTVASTKNPAREHRSPRYQFTRFRSVLRNPFAHRTVRTLCCSVPWLRGLADGSVRVYPDDRVEPA